MAAHVTALDFVVFGIAKSKGNHRAFIPKGMKHPIITESSRGVVSWQQLVAAAASQALSQKPAAERGLLTVAVRMTIAFYLPRPKKYKKPGQYVPHVVAPDIDRLERAILDALTQVAYADDKQVVEVLKGKYYAEVGGAARVHVRVEPAPYVKATWPPQDQPLFELTEAR